MYENERSEVSIHQVKVFQALKVDRWQTIKELSTISGITRRTVNDHLLLFVKMGIVDQAEVFPAHRYRLSSMAEKRNPSYLKRLQFAAEVFQDPPVTPPA